MSRAHFFWPSASAKVRLFARAGQACAHPQPTRLSFVRPRRRLSFAPTTDCRRRRAQTMSRLAAQRPPKARPLHRRARRHAGCVGSTALLVVALLTAPSTMQARCGRDQRYRGGARIAARKIAPATLYSVDLLDPDHDAHMRIGCEAPRRRAQSAQRHESHGFGGSPPPRTVIGSPLIERIAPKLRRKRPLRPAA